MSKQTDFLPHDVNLAATRDPIVLVVNMTTGAIKEIPCGPKNSSHINGDRPLVWSKTEQAAVVPKHWRSRFRRYDDMCRDAKLAKEHGISSQKAWEYFETYARFVQNRGRGKNTRPGMKLPELHPAIKRNPRGIKAKTSAETRSIAERLRELERRARAADEVAESRIASARAKLLELGMNADEVAEALG